MFHSLCVVHKISMNISHVKLEVNPDRLITNNRKTTLFDKSQNAVYSMTAIGDYIFHEEIANLKKKRILN